MERERSGKSAHRKDGKRKEGEVRSSLKGGKKRKKLYSALRRGAGESSG